MVKAHKFKLSIMEYGVLISIVILFCTVILTKLGSATGQPSNSAKNSASEQEAISAYCKSIGKSFDKNNRTCK